MQGHALAAAVLLTGARAHAVTGSFTPTQIQTAYGFTPLYAAASPLTGAGQTIALIDFGADPTVQTDLNAFDAAYGLPAGTVSTATYNGGSVGTAGDQDVFETALDVEYAHAIAPGAKILVVEADPIASLSQSAFNTEVARAITTAKATAGVSVVSMSFSTPETTTQTTGGGTNPLNDTLFQQGGGHANVAFVASAGDSSGVSYPASSPLVLGVGGTALTLTAANTRATESAWQFSGGGPSAVEPRPAYQAAAVAGTSRATPDVGYAAVDGSTQGFNIYVTPTQASDTSPDGATLTAGVLTNNFDGGTSAGAPQWAALVALVDQGLAAKGVGPVATGTLLDEVYTIYSNPAEYAADFTDITTGTSGSLSAGTGYDEVTGLGVPNAGALVTDLIAINTAAVPEPTTLGLAGVAAAAMLARRRRR